MSVGFGSADEAVESLWNEIQVREAGGPIKYENSLTWGCAARKFVSAPFSQNDRLSVPLWLAPLIQTLLNRLCSVQYRGRANATHQNRLIESRVTSDDLARNDSGLNRMFLPVTRRGGPKSLPESLDDPAFFHCGTHSGF